MSGPGHNSRNESPTSSNTSSSSSSTSIFVIVLVVFLVVFLTCILYVVIKRRAKERWSVVRAPNNVRTNIYGNDPSNDILVLAVSDSHGHIISYQFQKKIRFVSLKTVSDEDDKTFLCPICLDGNDEDNKEQENPGTSNDSTNTTISNDNEKKEENEIVQTNDENHNEKIANTSNVNGGSDGNLNNSSATSNPNNEVIVEVAVDGPNASVLTKTEDPFDIVMINCEHKFHRQCINGWLNLVNDTTKEFVHESCPTCRKSVVEYKFVGVGDVPA